MDPGRLLRRGALLLLPWLSGCGTFLLLQVRPAPSTNQGRPLYMLVRAVQRQAYLAESYQDATAKVMTPDKSVLRVVALHPGSSRRLLIGVPAKSPVGLYFLFAKPARSWRLYLDAPVPPLVTVDLEDLRIKP